MRGRTFSNCYVILDEAQNSTKEQMRMFLTRIGFNSQMCINGDHTQSDLELRGNEHGLKWVTRKLTGQIPGITFVEFSNKDIVRNPIITEILTYLDSPDTKKV
jgi:phosphate starvation-inducible PhoH-like protein